MIDWNDATVITTQCVVAMAHDDRPSMTYSQFLDLTLHYNCSVILVRVYQCQNRATHVLISSLHVYTKYCSLAINELNGHQWQWSPAPTIFFDIYVQNLRLHECMSVRRATIGRNNRAKCAWISKASRLLQYAPFTIPSETHKTAEVLPLKAHPPCVTPHASCHLQTDFLDPLLQTVDTVCRHTATTMSTNWRRYTIA